MINNGYKTIVIAGGDSALNDAANCLMREEKAVRESISLGVIPCGVMNDFAHFWNLKEGEESNDLFVFAFVLDLLFDRYYYFRRRLCYSFFDTVGDSLWKCLDFGEHVY